MAQLLRRIGTRCWYLRGRIPLLNLPVPCRLDGDRFLAHADETGLCLFLGIPIEPADRAFAASFLKPGMVFVDVGANQGLFSVAAARRVAPDGRVIAFEPTPGELRKLERNLHLNHCRNVTTVPAAVSSADGEARFFECLDGRGSYSSLKPPSGAVPARKREHTVRTVRLDSWLEQEGVRRVDLLKIDVEGAERDVLAGAARSLRELRPVVLCELADSRTQAWGYRARELHDCLREHGYEIFRAVEGGALRPAPRKESYDPDWENVIAVPRERGVPGRSGS